MDEAFRLLKILAPGQDLRPFDPIELAIVRARGSEQVRAELEARLVAVLHGDTTDLAKDYACRQLAICGSDAAVRPLTALLPNPRSSHMAQHAMEGIGGPGAAAALREMLAQTAGPQQVGIVISLGRLADQDAVPAIANLLAHEDPAICEAARSSLWVASETRPQPKRSWTSAHKYPRGCATRSSTRC